MPTPLTCYRVLASSPSDAMGEHEVVFDICRQITEEFAPVTGIMLWPTDWVRTAHADSGAEPQQLLNHQLVDECDIVVAFFRGKLGTPTQLYESGTVEEIERALEAGKHVAVYFWEPADPDSSEPGSTVERDRIEAYRRSLGGRLLYKSYRGLEDLRSRLRFDLTSLAHDLENTAARSARPRLSLRCVEGSELAEVGVLRATGNFIASRVNLGAFDDEIRTAYESVARIQLKPRVSDDAADAGGTTGWNPTRLAFVTPLEEVSAEDRELVTGELRLLGISPSESLFDLGTLHKGVGYAIGSVGPFGTDEEKAKFDELEKLVEACANKRGLRQYADAYRGISGILFSLENNGGSPAGNARVEIDLPSSTLCSPRRYPAPDEHFIDMLFNLGSSVVESFYTAKESPCFRSFSETCVPSESGFRMPPPTSPLKGSGLPGLYDSTYDRDDFRELVDYLTEDFDFKETSNGVRLSIKFDRVQHGAAYAFPSYVLVAGELPDRVHWRIHCDDSPEPFEGVLTLADSVCYEER